MCAEHVGGMHIGTNKNEPVAFCMSVRSAVCLSQDMATAHTALSSAMQRQGESKMAEYYGRVAVFRASMSLAKEMLVCGIITQDDYSEISRILARKYQLNPSTIFAEIP
jgi:hypothetical protein